MNNRVILSALLILVIASMILPSFLVVKSDVESVTYRLRVDGTAAITAIVSCPEDTNYVNVSLEEGYVEGSVMAFTKDGTPLYVEVKDYTAVIELFNLSETVILTYDAVVGNVSYEAVVDVKISPTSKSLVYLPHNSALVSASGDPEISAENNTIVLMYPAGGTYEITFMVLPPHTTTQYQTTTPATTTSGATTAPETKTPSGQGYAPDYLAYIVIGVVIIAVLALVYYFLKISRRGKPEAMEPMITSGLDDRDMLILKVLEGNEMSLSDISRATGLNKSVVWRRVKRLTDLGLLFRRIEKGKTIYGLTDSGKNALKTKEES